MAMYNSDDVDYKFVATTPFNEKRLALGYKDMNKEYDFIIRPYEDERQKEAAERLAVESDVIIIGSAPRYYLDIRMKKNKLSFRYSERVFRPNVYRNLLRYLWITYIVYKDFIKYKNKNMYLLCSSAYTARDICSLGFDINKCFKWGYYPDVNYYDIDNLINNKNKMSILWAGRIIDWKHTESVVKLADNLKKNNSLFHVNIIGTGEKEEEIKNMIEKYGLSEYVSMLGSMPPERVREHMEKSRIFIFTSDFNEGWGAVLNEAMNSGCVCIASHAIGSAPYLIKDGGNGFIYKNGDEDELFKKTEYAINNQDMCDEIGRKAYHTMTNMWNAETAAERFVMLSRRLLNDGNVYEFSDGPCSRAEILKNDWYKAEV